MPPSDYIAQLQAAVQELHDCKAEHVSTNQVLSMWEGQVAWRGNVETFRVIENKKIDTCYAWGFIENDNLQVTTVLGIPPIDSPSHAVDAAIASKGRR